MKVRLLTCGGVLFVALSARADTWTDSDGYTWTYRINGDTAEICRNGYPAAISPTTGAVTVPATLGGYLVTSIGSSAFNGCSGLTSVTIPDSVTSIGNSAFYGCSGLTSVTIPDSVTSIGAQAFRGCAGLTSVTIPGSVTSIGSSAFSGCSGLTSVTIPDSVIRVGNSAFAGCRGLTSVTIPDNVTSIGNSAFAGCSGLASVTIPNGVTSIGSFAFSDCSGLTSVTIPDSVTSIGNGAFSGCSRQTTLNVASDNLVYSSINNLLLSKDKKVLVGVSGGLTSATIPDSVEIILSYAFSSCMFTSVTIPDSVKFIGEMAFKGCSELASVTIPDSVKIIGDMAFEGCSELTSVTIPAGVKSIGDHTFSGCIRLRSVTMPDSVESIGEQAFSSCCRLTSVAISDGVKSIGDRAFEGCSELTSVTIGNGVKSIGDRAFEGCSELTSVMIPDGVENIGEQAFHSCSRLASVTIPDSVKRIGFWAFSGCNATLFDTTTIFGVKLVDGWAVDNIKPVVNGRVIDNEGVFFGDLDLSGVRGIGEHAFSDCRGLTSVTIGKDVKIIGAYAFHGCSGLTSVTIPDSVTSIGYEAFYGCNGLTSVTIGNGVKVIGAFAFYGCSSLASVTIPDSVEGIGDSAFDDCNTTLFDTTTIANIKLVDGWIVGNTGRLSGDLDLSNVRGIGDGVFVGCGGLTSMTIGNSVKRIESGAFSGCRGLMSFAVGTGNANYSSINGLLLSKDGKTLVAGVNGNVTIPDGVTSIGSYAFSDYSSLTSVTIPNSVTNIGECAFSHCSRLTSVTIPNGVTSIGDYAFHGCSELTNLTIPNSVTSIGSYSFSYCIGLTSMTIPDSVASIGSYAFSDCYGLTSVTIPDSVTSIGEQAFSSCFRLTSVSLPFWFRFDVELLADVFANCSDSLVFIYRDGATPYDVTVTFDANGGRVDEAFREVSVNTVVGTLPVPTRFGYVFLGWYTAASGGAQVTAATVVTGDATYYAQWTKNDDPTAPVAPAPVTPDPVTPSPITPDPVTPDPVTPDPVTPGPVTPEPVVPVYEVIEVEDIVLPYEAPKAVTLKGAVFDSAGVLGIVELKLGKVSKGKSKVSGTVTTLDGKKHTIKAVNVSGIDGVSPVTVSLDVKDFGMMEITIGGDKFAGSLGDYHVQSGEVGGAWAASSVTVDVAIDSVAMFSGMVLDWLLPSNEVATVSKGKWSFAKAASVKWAKPKKGAARPEIYDEVSGKGLIIDVSKGKTNLSGLKLTYTPKTGMFKGSFKVYALQGEGAKRKLKSYSVSVNGAVVGGVGYGMAACKKPALAWSVTVK